MDKLTALKQIEEATAYLKSLETPVTRPTDMPKDDEYYFWIGHTGEIIRANYWLNSSKIDCDRYEYGNCYLIKDAAEKTVAKQLATMRVLRKLRELEGNFVPDWSNHLQSKHCVYFDYSNYSNNTFILDTFLYSQYAPAEWYSTEKAYKYIIKNMQDDLKLMYGIER